MASFTVLEFSSEDCGTGHRLSNEGAKVVADPGLACVSVLLAQDPGRQGMGWPTDRVVSEVEADFLIHAEVKGGMAKGDVRERLRVALPQI
jgi:hypothetical protein